VRPGSCLALSHPAADIHAEEMAAGATLMNQAMAGSITFRTRAQAAAFSAGLGGSGAQDLTGRSHGLSGRA